MHLHFPSVRMQSVPHEKHGTKKLLASSPKLFEKLNLLLLKFSFSPIRIEHSKDGLEHESMETNTKTYLTLTTEGQTLTYNPLKQIISIFFSK